MYNRYFGSPCHDVSGSSGGGSLKSKCLNGGVCRPHLNEYKCQCRPGFMGPHCEQSTDSVDFKTPVNFDGKTQLAIDNKITRK